MANGLSIEYNDIDFLTECLECEIDPCCNDSCEGRIWVAPCGTINYDDGELNSPAPFCEPLSLTSMSYTDNTPIREKRYLGCKISRRRGIPDQSISLTFDICQGDIAVNYLLSKCSIDFVLVPRANNLNLELNPSLFDQQTKVIWGRMIGDTYTWEFPEDDCQTTTREFMIDRYCWETEPEAFIANAA